MNTAKIANRCPKCQAVLPVDASPGFCAKCLLAAVARPARTGEAPPDRPAPPSLDAVAAAFPQLEIIGIIGRGGMGVVYKARQPKLGRFVALKILPRSLGSDYAFAERFNREARILARLNHPNIVTVHDFGQSNGFFYLLMEYIEGVNLRQAMQAGRFSPQQALLLVPKICEALQFAHEEGILHRDIKPENILLDARGRVKIADFGIAKLLGEPKEKLTLTASGMVVGTPHYMAPEQFEHPQDVDQRADIYSLGVVFYEMLTGELPIGRFAPPSQKSPVDSRVDHVVLQALEKERERRQHNIAEVKTELEQINASPIAPANPAGSGVAASFRAPKTSPCYVSTPEYLRTLRGRFFSIHQARGELVLNPDRLRFSSGWQVVTIPLASIGKLAIGEYPISAKVAPLNYIEIAFDEQGASRTLLFTPMKSAIQPGWKANELVEEWLAALTEQIEAVTGRRPGVGRSTAVPAHAAAELAKAFILTAALSAVAFAVIPVITEHRLPNRLADYLPGPIVVAFTFVLLLAIRWWRHRFGSFAESAQTPLKRWQQWWLRRSAFVRKWLRGTFVVATLIAGTRFMGYSLEYDDEGGRINRHWNVGVAHPWLRISQPEPGAGFFGGIQFNPATDSFAAGFAALLLGWLTARLYQIERASLPFAASVAAGEKGPGPFGTIRMPGLPEGGQTKKAMPLEPGISPPLSKARRPFWWTVSASVFVAIGLGALIDTLADLYSRPMNPTFYPGLAHFFAAVAMLTLNRRWRVAALVALSLSVLGGAFVGVMMAVSPENGAVVRVPFIISKPIPVTEQPHLGAAVGVCLALLLFWPCYLLLSAKGKALFGLTKPV